MIGSGAVPAITHLASNNSDDALPLEALIILVVGVILGVLIRRLFANKI
jgi:uncharacterized membrane-anchored protein YhcB (DUF1043 family)